MSRIPGWAVVLRGDSLDLAAWRDDLKPGFEPWVEMEGADLLLRSCAFDGLNDASEVLARAEDLVATLNGAFLLRDPAAEPIALGGAVLRFRGDGGTDVSVVLQPALFKLRTAIMSPTVVVHAADGSAITPGPKASNIQAQMIAAASSDLLADALVFFGRPTNWFDLYKCFECLRKLAGGETKLGNLHPTLKSEIDLMTWTANSARHAPRVGQSPPPKPMELIAARSLVGFLLRHALKASLGNER